MDEQSRQYLVQHYSAADWLESRGAAGAVRDLTLAGSEVPGWTLLRSKRNATATPPFLQSLWQHGDDPDQLISVRIVECGSVAAAREQLLEELGGFQSPVITRSTGPDAVGDVAFGLGDTMSVFALANLVVVVLNAGRRAVSVLAVARAFDTLIRRRIS